MSFNFRSMALGLAALALTKPLPAQAAQGQAAGGEGPTEHGTLIIAGGGELGPEILGAAS